MKLNYIRKVILSLLILISLYATGQQSSIYSLNYFSRFGGDVVGFVPLSDGYIYRNHPDSVVLSPKYLGHEDDKNDNYHTLESVYRSRVLKQFKFEEDDTIYVYILSLDNIYTYVVKDIPMVAYLSPYGQDKPFKPNDYLIGFEIKGEASKHLAVSQSNALVGIGKKCPFYKEKLEALIFTEVEASEFPISFNERLKNWLPKEDVFETLLYSNKLYNYYAQTYGTEQYAKSIHLIVTWKASSTIVYEGYYRGSEGADPHVLNYTHRPSEYQYQWTGEILKGKPPIMIGFLSLSFGCPRIDFLGDTFEPIWIGCDNRH